jgi:hypothetical protein
MIYKLFLIFLINLSMYSFPFVDNGNQTITDTYTNLIWDKCTNGRTGSTCSSGTASTSRWNQALSICSSKGGTWRLPNLNELVSLIDHTSSSSPMIQATFFPNTLTDNPYWTSTTNTNSVSQAFEVYFSLGEQKWGLKSSRNNYVRCVSGP